MTDRKDWVQNDADEKSRAYQSRTGALAKRLSRVAAKASRDMAQAMTAILEDFRYVGGFASKAEADAWLRMRMDMAAWERLVGWIERVGDKPTRRKLAAKLERWTAGREFSRLDALNVALAANRRILEDAIKRDIAPVMVDTATDAYYREMFSIQKSVGIGWQMDALPGNWAATAAKSRLEATSRDFAKYTTAAFKSKLLDGIIKGKSTKEIAKDIEKTGTPAPVAMMAARTAITETAAETEAKALKEAGLDKFEFMATLDERTCPQCGALDGKVFLVEDKQVGVNAPPMHPNCRCVITAALTDEFQADTRIARDAKGKTIYVKGTMKYDEWRKTFIDNRKAN